ncbi:MAG: response regulator [Bacteriovoracaceae bacterium]|mgnify:CR=1 FL=1|nr:response regulator [Bacteriovoracaceae bacterium]
MNYKPIIVVIDDEPDFISITVEQGDELGYQVEGFTDPFTAVTYLKESGSRVCLVISDFNMPAMNGIKVKEKLNELGNSSPPFVILTGFWEKKIVESALSVGIRNVWEKPIDFSQVMEKSEIFFTERRDEIISDLEMIEGFHDESLPLLGEIEALILELEQSSDKVGVLTHFFRILHTIKGTAACVGLKKLSEFSHRYEDFVTFAQKNIGEISPSSVDVLLFGSDILNQFFTLIGETLGDDNFDVCSALELFSELETKCKNGNSSIAEGGAGNSSVSSNTDDSSFSKKKEDEKLPVNLSTLDEFMEQSGELTVLRNSITKTIINLEKRLSRDSDVMMLQDLIGEMYQVTNKIQGKITEMRKVPIGVTLRPFKRLARDLSKSLGKKVNFDIVGEDIKLDTVMARLLSGVLIHLIRNSLDHGIESPKKRIELGKNEYAELKIEVKEDIEGLYLSLSDDGSGINPKMIKGKILEKELLTSSEVESLNDHQLVNLIFLPGFSTKESVSDLSGRGVGTDMVKSSIEEFGGSIVVESAALKYTRFEISLPFPKSVQIINSLSVMNGDHVYLFNVEDVIQIVAIDTDHVNNKIETIQDTKFLIYRDEFYELVDLSSVFKLEETDFDFRRVILVQSDGKKFGVLVESVLEYEEVVCKDIFAGIDSINFFMGATFLGTGEVALILSVEGLAETISGGEKNSSNGALVSETIPPFDNCIYQFITFQNKAGETFSVDLEFIYRFERIESSIIQNVGDKIAIKYGAELLYLLNPLSIIGLDDQDLIKGSDFLDVIVVSVNSYKFGFLVYELGEIINHSGEINTDTFDCHGLSGTIYENGRTVSALDILYYYRQFSLKDDNCKLLEFEKNFKIA